MGDGDDGAYHAAWIAAGDRLLAEAEKDRPAGEPLPPDPLGQRPATPPPTTRSTDRRSTRGSLAAFRKQIAAFDAGLALLPHPIAPLRIPFEATTLPGLPLAGDGPRGGDAAPRHPDQRL